MSLKVKLFDEDHEGDLQDKINEFLAKLSDDQLIDIKYQVATMYDYKSQVYCFSAMVIYKEKKDD